MFVICKKFGKKLYFGITKVAVFYTFFILFRGKKGAFLYFSYTGGIFFHLLRKYL